MNLIRDIRALIGGAPSLTYLGSVNLATPTTPLIQSFDLGVHPSRDAVLIGAMAGLGSAILNKITVNGSQALIELLVTTANFSQDLCIWTCADLNDRYVNIHPAKIPAGSQPFFCSLWLATGLTRKRALATVGNTTATATARTGNLGTVDGGFVVGIAANNITAAQATAWTGDIIPTKRFDAVSLGGTPMWISTAEIFPTINDSANTLTATFDIISTTHATFAAAAFR